MEYQFRLSEVISGCESGAWLEGAVFCSENGTHIAFDGKNLLCGLGYKINMESKFAFKCYEEDL